MLTTSHLPSRECSRTAVRPFRAVIFGLVVVLGVPLRGTSWAQPVGSEFQVNTYTTSSQGRPAVAADAEGDFVAVWDSYPSQDGSDLGVFGQRYTSAGGAVGAEFQVNTYTTIAQYAPAVAADADGDFVVVWTSSGSGGSGQDGSYAGIFGQRYTSAGAAVGAEFQVNTYSTGQQRFPAVAADADGDFVVVWTSYPGQDGSSWGVFGQRYTSAGATVGTEFQANTYTTGTQGGNYPPAVAADADGDFVVVWSSAPGQDGSSWGVFAQRYTSAGGAVGAEFQVNTYTTSFQGGPRVAAHANGDFVVVWTSYGFYPFSSQDGSAHGSFGQRYTSTGAAVGAEFQVNTYTPNTQAPPSVATDVDGGFVVVWGSSFQDGSDGGVFGQRYTSAGGTVGAEFQVNTYTTGGQGGPIVAGGADGYFVMVWQSYLQDGSSSGVFGQRFGAGASTTTSTTTTTTTTSTSTTLPPSIPTLSGSAHLLLAALLAFAMFVLGLAWRLNSRAG